MKELKILIHGATGRLGKTLRRVAAQKDGVAPVCGVSTREDFSDPAFPVYSSLKDVKEEFDAIIDFSSPKAICGLTEFVSLRRTPVVVCTTGLSESEFAALEAAAKTAPVFICANASYGIAALTKLVTYAAKILAGYDAEIIEIHHKNKADAPSGTALTLANAIKSVYPEKSEIYGRNPSSVKRRAEEIGIHSIRGGTAVGEHAVMFLGENEVITLSHKSESRSVFAEGAIKAALFLADKNPGIYGMNDLT